MAEYDEARVEKAAAVIYGAIGGYDFPTEFDAIRDRYLNMGRAVLDVVAADIWDEGYEAGYDDAIFDQRGLSTDSDANEFPHANPYRADRIAGEQPRTREVGAGGTNGAVDGHGEGQGAEKRGETMEGDA